MNELAVRYDRLRRDTARLLNFDIDDLTPAQEVRLDRVSALRLEVDRLQMLQLSGQSFDLLKLVAASEMLENLMNDGVHLDLQPSQGQFAGAREELAAVIENLARASEYKIAEAHAREEAAMSEEAFDQQPVIKHEPKAEPPIIEEPTNVVAIPAHYLKSGQPAEPWRNYIDAYGNIRTSRSRWP